nr:MAG TPA: hypothetical protein [Bacteriophage sp.]
MVYLVLMSVVLLQITLVTMLYLEMAECYQDMITLVINSVCVSSSSV